MSGSSGGIFAGALSGGITGFIGSGFNPLGFIAGAALGGALGAAQVLLAPKPKKATHDVSDHIGSTSQRNIPVAIIFGRARIGAQYLILPPGDGQSIYMGTKAVDNQARVYLLHCQVSFGEGLLPPHGIGNYRISGKCITDYWIELSNKKVDPQWEDGTATEKRNATFFFDINRGSGLQAISNMILDVPYTNADLDNVLQPGSTPKPNGFSIDDGSGNRVLANTRMPIVPFRHTVTAACQLYTGYDVSLLDITADRAGANLALYDSGSNSGVNPGDTAGSVVGYDSYDQSFYWTIAASSETVTPFGIAKMKRDGSGGRTITRPPDGVTSNIARAWYYGKSDIVIMQDPSNRAQFFLGNWAIDPGSDLWETITPHIGQIPGGYDNQILAEHFDELNGILHTIHDDGSLRYIVRWNPLTGVVERVDTDMDSTSFRGMCYSADLYAYIIVDNDTIYAVSAETGETFASTTAMDVTAMKGVFVSGVRVGVIRTNGVNYWDTHDPANTYGRYGSADTDLDKGHFGGVTNAVQNTRTGQVAMTKPIDGTVAWINFIGSVCEDLQDISALGTSGQDQFQVFFGGYSEVPTGNTHSWNTGAVQEPYFQKVDPPVTQYTRTSGNISLQTSAKDDKLTFGSGSALDDLLVMVKQDEGVTDDWNGTAIRPTVHFTIPDDAIVIANTTGSFMSQENSAYYASCPKIFSDGDHTVNFPDGSHDPSVVDDYTAFQAAGFNVQFFNAGIDIGVLQDNGFIDGNGVFKCRLYHICCGRGQATVSSMGFISESIPQVDPDLVAGAFRDWSTRTFNTWDMVRLEGNSSLAAAMWNIIFDRTATNSGRYGGGLDASLGDITSFEAVHSRCVAGWKYPNKPKVVLQSGSESDETSVPLGENLADTGPSGTPDTSNSTSTTNSNSGSASDTDISHISQTYRMAERYKFDFLLQEQTTLSDLVLEQMLAACNGYMVMAGGVLQVGIPLPGYFASWHFEENSIEDASVSLSVASGSGIINRVRVQYLEVIDDYRVNTVTADREYDQMKFGRVGEKTLTLSGIGRQGHAQSIADQVVDDAIATRQSLVWKTHFVGFAFKPGDVIEISYRNTGLARAKFRITAMDEREKKTIQFTATEFKPTLATLASLAPAATPIGSIQTTIGSEVIHGECEEQTGSTGSGIRWFNNGAAYGSGHYNLNYVTNCAKLTPQTAPGGYIVQGWDVVTRKADNTIVVLDSAPAVTNPPAGWLTEIEAVRANAGQTKVIHLSTPGPIGLRLRHIPQYTNTGRYGPAPTYELCVGDEVVFGSHVDCNCNENDAWLIGRTYAIVTYNIAVTSWDSSGVPGFTVQATNAKLYWDGSKFAGYVGDHSVEANYNDTRWIVSASTTVSYGGNQFAVSGFVRSPANACKCLSQQSGTLNPTSGVVGQTTGSGTFGSGHGTGTATIKVCKPAIITSSPPSSVPTSFPTSVPPTSTPPITSEFTCPPAPSCASSYTVTGSTYYSDPPNDDGSNGAVHSVGITGTLTRFAPTVNSWGGQLYRTDNGEPYTYATMGCGDTGWNLQPNFPPYTSNGEDHKTSCPTGSYGFVQDVGRPDFPNCTLSVGGGMGIEIENSAANSLEAHRRSICEQCQHYLRATDECGYNTIVRKCPGKLKGGNGIRNPKTRCPLPEPKFTEVSIKGLALGDVGTCESGLGGSGSESTSISESASISVSDSENRVNVYPSDSLTTIQSKINTSPDNSTLFWHNGNYNITSQLNLKGGRKYLGESWNALLKTTGNFHAFGADGDNWSVKNLTFDGAGIRLASSRAITQWIIDNCQFVVRSQGSNGQTGVIFEGNIINNGQITNNHFGPIAGGAAIYGYNYNNLLIANNEVQDGAVGTDGIHIFNFNNGVGLVVEQNYGANLCLKLLEIQGSGQGMIFRDNWYEKPKLFSTFSQNDDCFAYSLIADTSTATRIYRNYSYAPERPDGVGCRIIFEVGGDDCEVYWNYSDYGNHVLAANDQNGSTSVNAHDNHFTNYLQGPGGIGLTQSNNGNILLPWSPSRGRPQRNVRYPGT